MTKPNNIEARTEDFLEHYGVKGMRWGFTRGKNGRVSKNGGRTQGSEDHEKAQEIRKKRVADMTNDELKVVTNRLQLEQSYARLNPKQVSKGKKFIDNTLKAAKTGTDLYSQGSNLYNSQASRDLQKLLKSK